MTTLNPAAQTYVPMPWPQPMPRLRHVIMPREGQYALSGHYTSVAAMHRLDTVDIPPGLYQTVRDDIASMAKIDVTRVALTKVQRDHAYIGIIDSDGLPFYFRLSSTGLATKRLADAEAAWAMFDQLMERERAAGLVKRREESAIAKAEKPYGHTAYTRVSKKTGKVSQVKAKGVKPTKAKAPESFALKDAKNPFKPDGDTADEYKIWQILWSFQADTEAKAYDALRPHMKRLFGVDPTQHDVDYSIKHLLKDMRKKGIFGEPVKSKPSADDVFDWHKLSQAFVDVRTKGSKYKEGIYPDAKNQKLIRDTLRAIIEKHGAVSRDVHPKMRKVHCDQFSVYMHDDALAVHEWGGRVLVTEPLIYDLQRSCDTLHSSPSYVTHPMAYTSDANGWVAAIHEELHGASRISKEAYQGVSMVIEEVTTELAAREITMAEFSKYMDPSLVKKVGGEENGRTKWGYLRFNGSYGSYIHYLHDTVADAFTAASVASPSLDKLSKLTTPEIAAVLCKASLRIKTWDGPEVNTSVDELIGDFTDCVMDAALELYGIPKNKDSRIALRSAMYDQLKGVTVQTAKKYTGKNVSKAITLTWKDVLQMLLLLKRNDVKGALKIRRMAKANGVWTSDEERMIVRLQDDPRDLHGKMAAEDREAQKILKSVIVKAATQPYGHIGYAKKTKRGYVFVKPKGVKAAKPTKASKPAKEQYNDSLLAHEENPYHGNYDASDEFHIWNTIKDSGATTMKEAHEVLKKNAKKLFGVNPKEHDVDYTVADVLKQMAKKKEKIFDHAYHAKKNKNKKDGFSTAWSVGPTDKIKKQAQDVAKKWFAKVPGVKPDSYIKDHTAKTMLNKCGLSVEELAYAGTVIDSWSGSSTASKACHFRGVVARAIGIPLAQELKSLDAADAGSNSKSACTAGWKGSEPPPKEIVAAAVAKMIKASREGYPKTVTLYRGTDQKIPPGSKTVACGVLSSWSTDKGTAQDFGNKLLTIKVPREAIVISHKATEIGLDEDEVLIACSGAIKVDSVKSHGWDDSDDDSSDDWDDDSDYSDDDSSDDWDADWDKKKPSKTWKKKTSAYKKPMKGLKKIGGVWKNGKKVK